MSRVLSTFRIAVLWELRAVRKQGKGGFLFKSSGGFCEYSSVHSLLTHPQVRQQPSSGALSVALAFALSSSPPRVQSRKPPVGAVMTGYMVSVKGSESWPDSHVLWSQLDFCQNPDSVLMDLEWAGIRGCRCCRRCTPLRALWSRGSAGSHLSIGKPARCAQGFRCVYFLR